MIETAEGAVAMSETPGKGFAVLTRLPSGRLGFRQLLKVVTSGPVGLVRIVLDSGQSAVATRDHVFYRAGMEAVAAAELRAGDALETAFQYPPGYTPPDWSITPMRRVRAAWSRRGSSPKTRTRPSAGSR